jgi:hypothetical protein
MMPLLSRAPEAIERAADLADWAFRERPDGIVFGLEDVRLAPPVPMPASIRDTMSY